MLLKRYDVELKLGSIAVEMIKSVNMLILLFINYWEFLNLEEMNKVLNCGYLP